MTNIKMYTCDLFKRLVLVIIVNIFYLSIVALNLFKNNIIYSLIIL